MSALMLKIFTVHIYSCSYVMLSSSRRKLASLLAVFPLTGESNGLGVDRGENMITV